MHSKTVKCKCKQSSNRKTVPHKSGHQSLKNNVILCKVGMRPSTWISGLVYSLTQVYNSGNFPHGNSGHSHSHTFIPTPSHSPQVGVLFPSPLDYHDIPIFIGSSVPIPLRPLPTFVNNVRMSCGQHRSSSSPFFSYSPTGVATTGLIDERP